MIRTLLFVLFIGVLIGGLVLITIANKDNKGNKKGVINVVSDKDKKRNKIGIILSVVSFILTILVPPSFHQVEAGQVAVVKSLGKVVGTGAMTSISPETAIASTAGAFMEGLMESQDKEELMPVVAKGNTNVGDVTYACGKTNFEYYQMSCKNEYAQICDQFLSRYGYKVNEIKTPNILSRTKFNYIKIGTFEELVHGDIPASDLEEINSIFRKGVTIFHDYTTFGDYTQTNSIVTNP